MLPYKKKALCINVENIKQKGKFGLDPEGCGEGSEKKCFLLGIF